MDVKTSSYSPKSVLSITYCNDVLHICKINKNDAWNTCDFVAVNEDRLALFFPKTREQNLTPDLSKRFTTLKEKQFESREEFLFVLRVNESKKIFGFVYIKELHWDILQGEFGYAIDYSLEGKGIISKIVKELSSYAFETLKLNTLQIITHKTNIGSVKVAEKCGFVWVKTLKNEFAPKGKDPMDMELYELYK